MMRKLRLQLVLTSLLCILLIHSSETLSSLANSSTTSVLASSLPSTVAGSFKGNNSSKNKTTIYPQLNTRGPPILVNEGKDKVLAYVRDNVELECPINSLTHSIFEWYKGGERITELWERFKITDQGRLKIHSVTHEDSGTFLCRVVNGFGSNQFEVQLAITGDDPLKYNYLKPIGKRIGFNDEDYSAPVIIEDQLPSEKTLKVLRGDNLQLKCGSRGNPQANTTWLKNNETIISTKENSLTLKLMNLTESNSGQYKCVSENVFGKAEYEILLEVTGSWQGAAEIIELSPSNVTLHRGQSTTITCVARFESDSFQMLFWVKQVGNRSEGDRIFLHNGRNYELLARTEIKELEKHVYSTELVLANVTRKDSGNYTCAVAGLMGFNHSQVQVIVLDDPALAPNTQKKQKAALEWAALWTIAFLIIAILILFCFSRIHGFGRTPLKKPPVANKSQKNLPLSSSSSLGGKARVSSKSPGETVQTTLSHLNEVSQPLLVNPQTNWRYPVSCSSSLTFKTQPSYSNMSTGSKRDRSNERCIECLCRGGTNRRQNEPRIGFQKRGWKNSPEDEFGPNLFTNGSLFNNKESRVRGNQELKNPNRLIPHTTTSASECSDFNSTNERNFFHFPQVHRPSKCPKRSFLLS